MINKTIIQGRLTEVPQLKTVGGNHSICNTTVAWNKKYNDKETALFLRCKFWNAKANFLCNYFTKGSEIIVAGELQTESWVTEDGQNRSITVLNVDDCHFCGPKQDNPKTNNTQPYMNNPQQTNYRQQNNYQQQNLNPQAGFSVGDFAVDMSPDGDGDFPY